MKKAKIVFITVFSLLVVGAAAYYIMEVVYSTPVVQKPVVISEEEKIALEKTLDSMVPEPVDIEAEMPMDMLESSVQHAIHIMSHQKIKADRKWGFLQITPQRIDRLIEVVEANSYQYEATYLSILYAWKEGDFSRVDQDHNAIWKLQGGTIGEATGVLSLQEEIEFLEENQ